jgi:hypothetical protein
MAEGRGPRPPGGGGGFQTAISGTDFKGNSCHNSGEWDNIRTVLCPCCHENMDEGGVCRAC